MMWWVVSTAEVMLIWTGPLIERPVTILLFWPSIVCSKEALFMKVWQWLTSSSLEAGAGVDTGVFKIFGLMAADVSEYFLFLSFSFEWSELELSVLLLLNWRHGLSVWAEAGATGALRLSSMLALFTTPLFLPPTLACPASVASNAAGLPNPTPRASRRGRGHNRSCLLLKKVRCRWWGRHCTHTGVCSMSGMGATVTGSCL